VYALFEIDWQRIFVPSNSVLEIIVRGTLTYLALFILMRAVLKRETGTVSLADLLMIVLIADASQNAMASEYKSVTEGVVLVMTLIFWNYTLDWLGSRIPLFGRLIHPSPLKLIEDGRLLRRNMRKESITEEEMMSHLRERGVEDVSRVKAAYMEGDGRISVIKAEGADDDSGSSSAQDDKRAIG